MYVGSYNNNILMMEDITISGAAGGFTLLAPLLVIVIIIIFCTQCRISASVNTQKFIQRCCDINSVKSYIRYKVKFKLFPDDGSLVKAGCQIEEQEDGTFKHIWTRVNVKTEGAWQDLRKIDVVRPGRYWCMICI